MPPFLMLLAVAFVVLMVMFGNNPMDKIRAEREKYGRDPLARDIKKFNEERGKKSMGTAYKPPPGATLYRLPPNQAQLRPSQNVTMPGEETLVRPAPDIPIDQWEDPTPSYLTSPVGTGIGNAGMNTGITPRGDNVVMPRKGSGTSLMPGFGAQRQGN